MLFWTNSECSTLQNSISTAIYHPSHKPSKYDEQDMPEMWERTHKWHSSVDLNLDPLVLGNHQTFTFITLVDTGCRLEDLPIAMANKDR